MTHKARNTDMCQGRKNLEGLQYLEHMKSYKQNALSVKNLRTLQNFIGFVGLGNLGVLFVIIKTPQKDLKKLDTEGPPTNREGRQRENKRTFEGKTDRKQTPLRNFSHEDLLHHWYAWNW